MILAAAGGAVGACALQRPGREDGLARLHVHVLQLVLVHCSTLAGKTSWPDRPGHVLQLAFRKGWQAD